MGKHLESYKKLIGKKIQRRRVELGIDSQESLAGKVGVDQSHVSKWESGKNLPEGKLRRTIADVLKVSDDFFELIELNPSDDIKERLCNQIIREVLGLNEFQLNKVIFAVQTIKSPRKKVNIDQLTDEEIDQLLRESDLPALFDKDMSESLLEEWTSALRNYRGSNKRKTARAVGSKTLKKTNKPKSG